jgi:hypothetical protein
MSRVKLRVTRFPSPHRAEAFLRLPRRDGIDERITARVDTAAHTSLLPDSLLTTITHRLTQRGKVIIEQAGMSKHTFEAVEATILVFLEDEYGGQTAQFEAPFWFADTDQYLLGVTGMLDRAILHLDMPALTGTLEFPD